MKNKIIGIITVALVIGCATPGGAVKIRPPRGIAAKPEGQARLQRAMAKMRRGEPISLVALGASITTGFQAGPPETNGWAGVASRWWQEKAAENNAEFIYRNAGVSGTDSAFASIRIKDHVLAFEPDVVFVEFAMNDQWLSPQVRKRSYEGVLRQILADSERAVALVAINQRDGADKSNRSEQEPIGNHYQLPTLAWADWQRQGDLPKYFNGSENIHPNTAGHANIAEGIIAYLDSIWNNLPPDDAIPSIDIALPPPLVSDEFQYVDCLGWEKAAEEDAVISSNSWSEGSDKHNEWASRGAPQPEGWTTDKTDAELQIAVKGKSVGVLYAESSLYRNGSAWVSYPDGKTTPKVPINCYVSYRVGYLGWAYAEVANNLGAGAILHIGMGSGGPPGQKTNVVAVVCTGVRP
ncbi:MAG: SGNH/GDSL hydrolase family protein [Treponema sp.]|nr:SGNH/GDSL hydrolase family protein [Treponema sp.]